MSLVPGVVGISFEEKAIGRTLSDSKVRTTWSLSFDSRRQNIELTNSRITGKKKVYLNSELIHEESSMFGTFTFSWRLAGRECLMLPNRQESGYDLFVEGVSFYDLLPGTASVVSGRDGRTTQWRDDNLRSSSGQDAEMQRAIEQSIRDEKRRKEREQNSRPSSRSETVGASSRWYSDRVVTSSAGLVGWKAIEESETVEVNRSREFERMEPRAPPPRVPPPSRRPPALPNHASPKPVIEDLINLDDISFPALDTPKDVPVAHFEIGSPSQGSRVKSSDPVMDWLQDGKNGLVLVDTATVGDTQSANAPSDVPLHVASDDYVGVVDQQLPEEDAGSAESAAGSTPDEVKN